MTHTEQADHDRILAENARKTVLISDAGIFIGGEPFMWPVEEGSVQVQPCRGRYNRVRLTLLVGQVVVETRKRMHYLNDIDDAAEDCSLGQPDGGLDVENGGQ